ncbi:MAG: C/D box methylation guide ribonucleoprotein complex aNOP56 subunit [Candidatus Helarchaeota archaeon]|nr:C/D box methylation guide ribonucleoprotein complex aNOP56 subunit [Candidatus Helarchaeota archaeon]
MIRAFIVETPFGIFGLNQESKIVSKKLFSKEASSTVEKLVNLQIGKVIPEIEEVIDDLILKNYDELIFENKNLAKNLKDKPVTVEFPSEEGKILRSKLISFIKELKIWGSEEEIYQHVQRINILTTRQKIKEISEEKDRLIAQAIEAVDDCDKSLNIFASRIREWYGLHFPELDKKLPSHTSFIKIVGKVGLRDQILTDAFENAVGFPPEKIEMIKNLAKGSMGATITDFELKPLQKFAIVTEQLYGIREMLATYVDEAMQEVAPNMRALVGALLGARLISLAGSLKRLSRLPASTVQVLGAEKALFRALRTGAKPPKHGIIFQWEDIHGAPYWLKGKIARVLAGKLSMAARIDYFSGEYHGDNLLEDLNRRINDIRKKYPSPPKKPKKEKPEKTGKKPAERERKKHRKRKKRRKKKPK